jgi:hypothetical protein
MYQELSDKIIDAISKFMMDAILAFFSTIPLSLGLHILIYMIWITVPSLNHSFILDCTVGLMVGVPFGLWLGSSIIRVYKARRVFSRLYIYGIIISFCYCLLLMNGKMHYYENCNKNNTLPPFRISLFHYIC